MRADDTLDWTTYLEELEQEAIRLRPRRSSGHWRSSPGCWLDSAVYQVDEPGADRR